MTNSMCATNLIYSTVSDSYCVSLHMAGMDQCILIAFSITCLRWSSVSLLRSASDGWAEAVYSYCVLHARMCR